MQRFKYELTLLWAGTGIKLAVAFYIITAAIAVIQGTERIAQEQSSHQLYMINSKKTYLCGMKK